MDAEDDRLAVILPEDVSFKELLRIYMALNELVKCCGGADLVVEDVSDGYMDQNTSLTGLVNKACLEEDPSFFVPTNTTPCTPREEVYEAIELYVKPEKAQQVRQELDRRYPLESWKNSFPTFGACYVLINNHSEHLYCPETDQA
jgi:hypothetical protein